MAKEMNLGYVVQFQWENEEWTDYGNNPHATVAAAQEFADTLVRDAPQRIIQRWIENRVVFVY
jgi:hypothetical protein